NGRRSRSAAPRRAWRWQPGWAGRRAGRAGRRTGTGAGPARKAAERGGLAGGCGRGAALARRLLPGTGRRQRRIPATATLSTTAGSSEKSWSASSLRPRSSSSAWSASTGREPDLLELLPLGHLDGEQLGPPGRKGAGHVAHVLDQLPQGVGLQRGRVVRPFPRAVQREVTLDPLGTQGHGGDVGGDAQVMAGKADPLAGGPVFAHEPFDFQERELVEGNRVPGDAGVEHRIFQPSPRLEEP